MHRALLLSAVFCPSLACASSFQSFDVSGATTTCGAAIASNGKVVGVASGGTVASATPFIFDGTAFHTPKIVVTNSVIIPSGINRHGTIIGSAIDIAQEGGGLFEFRGGVTTLLPNLLTLTAINDAGAILVQVARVPAQPLVWYDIGEVIPPWGSPLILDDGTGHLYPTGMDQSANRVVGYSYGTTSIDAWSYYKGTFTPIGVAGATYTQPAAVNKAGQIAGTYYTGTSPNLVSHGFFLTGTNYTTWDAPGATATEILGANETGAFTGCYTDSTGVHGFIARQ
jgi:hypothetical protein